jgi:hypothetical protein
LTVTDATLEPGSPEPAAGPRAGSVERTTEPDARGRSFTGVGVTAGAAVVAGLLLLTRDESVSTLGTLAIIVGAVAVVVTAAAVREWPWARSWTGPNGALEGVAGPMAWLAVVFAAVVVLANFVPVIVPAWDREQVFAVAIVAFIVLSVLGWGPGVNVAWPSGLRLSSMMVLGSLLALVLVAGFVVLIVLMRADALVADDRQWARLVEIRATLGAVAFAAAGALLGIIVQRQAQAGELRRHEELIRQQEDELQALRAVLSDRELRVESMLASTAAAVRLLTPDAPDDLERMDPVALAALTARPPSTAVRQARRTLLESLKAASD